MSRRLIRHVGLLWVAAIAALVFGFVSANGQDAPEGEMSKEMQEMMALFAKYAEPSAHHEHLHKMVGEWEISARFWMGPEEMTTTGTQKTEAILGGRYIKTEFTGNFMGDVFHGIGIDGYDNYSEKHVGLWIDSASTMMMTFVGTCSDGGKVITMEATYNDPRSGGESWQKGVTTWIDDDHFKYEAWEPGPDGEAMRTMEIQYTRKS
jgi:hypothetical protein